MQDGSIVLCDSPGFGDTAGIEVNIANGIGTVRAVQKCNSVKPLVVLDAKSLNVKRGASIRELGQTVTRFIKNLESSETLRTCSYIFTKCSTSVEDNAHPSCINPTLTDLLRNLTAEEKGNTTFVALLKDMVEKTKHTQNTLSNESLRDTGAQDEQTMLKTLMSSPAITEPHNSFSDYATPAAMRALIDQLSTDRNTIRDALMRCDYTLAGVKLLQIKNFLGHLSLPEFSEAYSNCCGVLESILESIMANVKDSLARLLQDGQGRQQQQVLAGVGDSMSKLIQIEASSLREQHAQTKPVLTIWCTQRLSECQLHFQAQIKMVRHGAVSMHFVLGARALVVCMILSYCARAGL